LPYVPVHFLFGSSHEITSLCVVSGNQIGKLAASHGFEDTERIALVAAWIAAAWTTRND
jgi:hypothetical protein